MASQRDIIEAIRGRLEEVEESLAHRARLMAERERLLAELEAVEERHETRPVAWRPGGGAHGCCGRRAPRMRARRAPRRPSKGDRGR